MKTSPVQLILLLLLILPSLSLAKENSLSEEHVQMGKRGKNHIEYYLPSYAPDVWYDEESWTITVYGDNYYTYLDYNIYDPSGVCQLSSCIDGGNNLIDLPTLSSGTCTIEFIANNGDTYIGYFVVH